MRILHRQTPALRPAGDDLVIDGEEEAFGAAQAPQLWVPSCCQAPSARLGLTGGGARWTRER